MEEIAGIAVNKSALTPNLLMRLSSPRDSWGYPFLEFADIIIFHTTQSLSGIFSGINIKLMKCTGMREGWRMAQLARALGMKVMVGCMTETSCGISAAAQFSPYVDFADLDGNLLISNDRFDGVKVIDGRLSLPDRPGIGVELL